MAEVIKIVLTGGPCAGKTTALAYVAEKLREKRINTLTVDECATKLILSGKTPQNMGIYEFHKLLFETQLKEEREKNEQTARSLSAAKDELSRLEDEQNSLKDASAKQIYWQNEQEKLQNRQSELTTLASKLKSYFSLHNEAKEQKEAQKRS